MEQLIELAVRGILLGVTYGLLAFPISLIFLATDTVDLAIGAYAVLAAVTAFVIGGPLGIAAGICVATVASAITGTISGILSRRDPGNPLVIVLASFGFAVMLESTVLSGFGHDPVIRQPFDTFWNLGGIRISPQAGINVLVGTLIMFALYLLLYRSPWGRMMRASAINPRGAQLAGIPVRAVQFSTFLLTGILAGIAGVLILYTSGTDFAAGLHLTLTSFGAAILFGLQGPMRGFIGGIAIGVVESLSAGFASGGLATMIPLIFIFTVLATGKMSREGIAGGRA
ncbi:MAG: inner-rane translocator [Herminiimonas sp.]|nr:inner-rane translocator [Herminiimonas sp.]